MPGSYLGHAALCKHSISTAAASPPDNQWQLMVDGWRGGAEKAAGFYANSPRVGLSPPRLLSLLYYSADMRRMNFPRRAQAGCITQQHRVSGASDHRWQQQSLTLPAQPQL